MTFAAFVVGFLVLVVVVFAARRLLTGSVEIRSKVRGREEPVAWRVIAMVFFLYQQNRVSIGRRWCSGVDS